MAPGDRVEELERQLARRTGERDALEHSPEYRFGDLMLNKLRLRPLIRGLEFTSKRAVHRCVGLRLAAERRFARRPRAMASICGHFPIYSQTFVYQELCELVRHGVALRHVYSFKNPRSYLPERFGVLWNARRKLQHDHRTHVRDFQRYKRKKPEKVAKLTELLAEASGKPAEWLEGNGDFLRGFSYARLVEAWRPDYLHSYFFYEGSLYGLIAGFLLDLPRGVSSYADHLLEDYDLKVVPLHLRLCDVVIATSARIKDELAGLAPDVDPDKILVKPNAIDAESFPVADRPEPADGEPYRLVCVSRIEPKKGLLHFADAMRILRDERGLKVEAHLIGEPDTHDEASQEYAKELWAFVERHGLQGTVHLEGRKPQDEVRRFLDTSQVFVAPFVETETGDKDGIPTALLEAISTGIVPLTTDAGSMLEVVEDGRNGVVVPQKDAKALADAIEDLVKNKDRRQALGKAAAAKARAEFDVRVCEARFHERVDRLLGGAREPGS